MSAAQPAPSMLPENSNQSTALDRQPEYSVSKNSSDQVWILQITLMFTLSLVAGIICTVFSISTIAGTSRVMPWSGWVGVGVLCYGVMASVLVVIIEQFSAASANQRATTSSHVQTAGQAVAQSARGAGAC